MGRKPADNPKATTLGIRVNADQLAAIDEVIAEVRREHPGMELTRSDIVRSWINEAIARRAKRK